MKELLKATIRAVPQWYQAEVGPHRSTLAAGDNEQAFFSPRGLTPNLRRLRHTAENRAARWLDALQPDDGDGEAEGSHEGPFAANLGESFQEALALKWLQMATENGDREVPSGRDVDWRALLTHARRLRHRTHENAPVAVNLIIGPGEGSKRITDVAVQGTLDPLLRSPRVYVHTDPALRFEAYGEIPPDGQSTPDGYSFHPTFITPLVSALSDEEFGVHLTPRGDFIIVDDEGLLACWRKGQWHLYDVQTLKNGFAEAMNGAVSSEEVDSESEAYRVGCNLFELALDLSYQRHGALLVYDPDGDVLPHVTNPEAVLSSGSGEPGAAHTMLAPSVEDIRMAAWERAARKKRLFLELAGMDGAVIFNGERLLAFGAMIQTHPQLEGSHRGARTTAAWSALRWGSRPIKVSEDGDIEVLFQSEGSGGRVAPQAFCRSGSPLLGKAVPNY